MSNIETNLVHLGRRTARQAMAVNPPLVRASTTVFANLDEFREAYNGVAFETPKYGRTGTGTVFELQSAMAEICNTESCIATASGLSAIAATLAAHAKPGAEILIQADIYGPTRALADKELNSRNCSIKYFSTVEEMCVLVNERTSLVFVEIPTSLTMKMLDVAEICDLARHKGVPVACDATWGSPIFFDAHAHGVDISIHAGTKYINGHSDVMLGLVTGSYKSLAVIRNWCENYGSCAAPDVCWLGLRGLRTLDVRMERHQKNAMHVANWLQDQPLVKNIRYPAMPSDDGHGLWRKLFTGGAGPFTIELMECNETSFKAFINSFELFGLGTSWGGFESLVMPAIPHSLRASGTLPDHGRLVRLHVGLENPNDLCRDLQYAFLALVNSE